MVLKVNLNTSALEVASISNSIEKPGGNLEVKIKFVAKVPLVVESINWNLPKVFKVRGIEGGYEFPLKIEAGETKEQTYFLGLKKGKEGFGDVHVDLIFSPEALEKEKLSWDFWCSALSSKTLNNEEELPEDCRKRLIEVVNANDRNGHIFLAHPVNFFKDFLNISMPKELGLHMMESMDLTQEGLPVEESVYEEFVMGKRKFFGIEKLEIFPEEERGNEEMVGGENGEVGYQLKI